MKSPLAKKIQSIMSTVFNVPENDITEDTSPDNLPVWDSLKHMNLVSALEEEFDTTFSDDDIMDMLNFKLVEATLSSK